jgi:hypothetical protein
LGWLQSRAFGNKQALFCRKEPENMPDPLFILRAQPALPQIIEKESKPLSPRKNTPRRFIETGDVFVLPVL